MTGLVEDIKVIIHENEKRKFYIEDIDALVDEVVSTVAVRIQVNGEQYGQYTVSTPSRDSKSLIPTWEAGQAAVPLMTSASISWGMR